MIMKTLGSTLMIIGIGLCMTEAVWQCLLGLSLTGIGYGILAPWFASQASKGRRKGGAA